MKKRFIAVFTFAIFLSNSLFAAQNNLCLSLLLKQYLQTNLRQTDLEALKSILTSELVQEDLISQLEAIDSLEKIQEQIAYAWENALYEIIYSNAPYPRPKEAHPLQKYLYRGTTQFLKLTKNKQQSLFDKYPGLYDAYVASGTKWIPEIKIKQSAFIKSIEEQTQKNPKQVKKIIHELFTDERKMKNESVDHLLGIHFNDVERTVQPQKYEGQETWHSSSRAGFLTPYDYIKSIYHQVSLTEADTVYDLGAGYGRVLFYGAHLKSETTFKGVELVTERAQEMERIVMASRLSNITIINKNVLDVDFSDGTVFYLFNPFPRIMEEVGEKLKRIGVQKKIRIASHGFSTNYFESCKWLKQISYNSGVTVFESILQK